MTRSTTKLKELIFTKLNNDTALRSLLGGLNKIKHANPLQKSDYPCVVYSLYIDIDNPYNIDNANSEVVKTRLHVEVFTEDTSSKIADSIEDRIYYLLNGKKLSNTNYLVYTCYRVSREEIYEPDIETWRILTKYDLTNVPK